MPLLIQTEIIQCRPTALTYLVLFLSFPAACAVIVGCSERGQVTPSGGKLHVELYSDKVILANDWVILGTG